MTKAKKKLMEEYLDERWDIATYDLDNRANVSYYDGIIKAIELMGFSWERKNGKHTIY